jgi:hypothetical protein
MTPQEKDEIRRKVMDVIENSKQGIGRTEFIDFLYGDNLQAGRSIRAYCFDCMGWYIDEIDSCGNQGCPLFKFNPYNPSPMRKTVRGKPDGRNELFPMDERIYPKQNETARRIMPLYQSKVIEANITAKKLKPRKYPQEITQKEPS